MNGVNSTCHRRVTHPHKQAVMRMLTLPSVGCTCCMMCLNEPSSDLQASHSQADMHTARAESIAPLARACSCNKHLQQQLATKRARAPPPGLYRIRSASDVESVQLVCCAAHNCIMSYHPTSKKCIQCSAEAANVRAALRLCERVLASGAHAVRQ